MILRRKAVLPEKYQNIHCNESVAKDGICTTSDLIISYGKKHWPDLD